MQPHLPSILQAIRSLRWQCFSDAHSGIRIHLTIVWCRGANVAIYIDCKREKGLVAQVYAHRRLQLALDF